MAIQDFVKFSHIKDFEDVFGGFSVVVRLSKEGANAPTIHGEPTKFYEFIEMHVLVFHIEPT